MQIDIHWLRDNFARFNARYFSDLLPVPRFGVGHSRTRLGTLSSPICQVSGNPSLRT